MTEPIPPYVWQLDAKRALAMLVPALNTAWQLARAEDRITDGLRDLAQGVVRLRLVERTGDAVIAAQAIDRLRRGRASGQLPSRLAQRADEVIALLESTGSEAKGALDVDAK